MHVPDGFFTASVSIAAGAVAAGGVATAGDDQRVGVEVRVALSTLLGHDGHPGEIAGLGPVPASHARTIVAQQRRADPDGHRSGQRRRHLGRAGLRGRVLA